VVLEVISGSQSAAEACRRYGLKPQVLSRWKAEFLEHAAQVFQSDEQRSQEQARIAELERLVGRQALELEILHLPWRAVPGKKASRVLDSHLSRSEA